MLQVEIGGVRDLLRGAGLGRDARIAVALASSAQATRAIVAIACSAVSIPIDPKLTVTEVERCFAILRPSAIVVLRGQNSAARTAAEQRGVPVIEADFSSGLSLDIPRSRLPAPHEDPDPDAPAFILHTSGTTATPNLVPFSHRNMLASTERLRTWFGLTPQDRCLSVTPIYYSH